MSTTFNRRNVLRGMMAGGAVTVGLPFLDCFLNSNGTALADGTALPTVFGTWFQGLGYNPGFWEPKTIGANYDNNVQLKPLDPFKKRINIFSGLKVFLDSNALIPHATGQMVSTSGGISKQGDAFPSIDVLIGDTIGTRTRFRSIEVSCDGTQYSNSKRSGSSTNPSETSPSALYTRIFGPEFKDPNAADFTPDPAVMASRSALSAITEQRQSFVKDLGAADKARLDEYFTSLRDIEQQLDLELQKPAPMAACTIPEKGTDAKLGPVVEDVRANHRLFAKLIAHALACGQTRVFNLNLAGGGSSMRRAGNAMTFHMYTHEEELDKALGYQPNVAWMQQNVAESFAEFVNELASIKEGANDLLHRSLVFYTTDHGLAKIHSLENIPQLTAGEAGGRMKTGLHISSQGDAVTRVGLSLQQIMGVPVTTWGTETNKTSKPFTELFV